MALARTARMHWAGTYDRTLDYAAGTVVRQGGGLYCARLLRPHGAAAPVDDAASWDTLAPAPAQAGVPVLYGPYVVDYNMLANGGGTFDHDGATVDLWTPQVGDVLLRIVTDWQTEHTWDQGLLFIGQNVDCTGDTYKNVISRQNTFVSDADGGHSFATLDPPSNADFQDSAGLDYYATAYVFHTTDPVQIQLAQTGGTDPARGHVEIYALVCRAVAP